MTRLTFPDIENIASRLDEYDETLHHAVGCGLKALSLDAAGFKVPDKALTAMGKIQVAVVPIGTGLGEINGFAETVDAILRHIGMRSFVTKSTDVAGVVESFDRRSRLIFMSDDDRFVALCPERRALVDNIDATALGFATGLSRMAPPEETLSALVLGCGPLGRSAAGYLARMGMRIGVCDQQEGLSKRLAETLAGTPGVDSVWVDAKELQLRNWPLIFEATNALDLIGAEDVTQRTRIAAPGMPCGVTPRACQLLGPHLLHDPLQIGVATMATLGLKLLAAPLRKDER